jgi:phosphatidylcholine synthase
LPPVSSTLAIAILIVLTFVPVHVIHPVRVRRFRAVTLSLIAIWAVLAIWVLARDFDVATPVTVALCAVAAYIVGADAVIRLTRSFRT